MVPPSDVEEALSAFAAALNESSASSPDASILESKLSGPDGVVTALLPKLWLPQSDPNNSLSILVHLVEAYPKKYMNVAASAIRRDIEHNFDTTKMDTTAGRSNSDTQTGIATDAHAALLALCKWDNHEYHKSNTCQTLFQHLATLWKYLQQQQKDKLRESSTAQMRIAALMIDVCLLGGKEVALALSDDTGSIAANDSLDALEVLAVENKDYSMTRNDELHNGLLYLIGSSSENVEFDPINGYAALRLLTEICRVGISSSTECTTKNKFYSLLESLQGTGRSIRPSDYISLSLYHAFGEANNQKDPTECLLASAKSPFVEERLGAYNVLRAMASRGCCVRMLLLYKGEDGNSIFVEWLLNQDNEFTNEGRQAKYNIVQSLLADDNNIEGLISTKAFREMQLWMKRGPAHITTFRGIWQLSN
ncbi:26S proteasome subunit S5B [Skeletonema marinoi]|uniref:26S proteasome subunit S5B n=1 Tax=Skeletonema marinoi TaxID=267567 RepID=A0AAD8YFT1_9STRA|nr:26S proteasome subunit S5B [Skeletonema marinoi]